MSPYTLNIIKLKYLQKNCWIVFLFTCPYRKEGYRGDHTHTRTHMRARMRVSSANSLRRKVIAIGQKCGRVFYFLFFCWVFPNSDFSRTNEWVFFYIKKCAEIDPFFFFFLNFLCRGNCIISFCTFCCNLSMFLALIILRLKNVYSISSRAWVIVC